MKRMEEEEEKCEKEEEEENEVRGKDAEGNE